ncbi:uncharacterized protein M6D78_004779 [Vipera latastei]
MERRHIETTRQRQPVWQLRGQPSPHLLPIPYRKMQSQKIEAELDKLVGQGVLEPVEGGLWETPIVTPLKPNGDVRICADYKATLNLGMKKHAYPVPTVKQVLATIQDGAMFAKLDLAQAYLQLTVSEEAAEAQTIVTHKGAFRVHRLQFGIAAAPGIFQEVMERTLKGIPGVCPYFDDVLIAGKNEEILAERLEQDFLKANSIKHKTSAPFHPSTNGLAERNVRTTKDALKRIIRGDWHQRLAEFLLTQHTTPCTATGKSPAEMRQRHEILFLNPPIHPTSHPPIPPKGHSASLNRFRRDISTRRGVLRATGDVFSPFREIGGGADDPERGSPGIQELRLFLPSSFAGFLRSEEGSRESHGFFEGTAPKSHSPSAGVPNLQPVPKAADLPSHVEERQRNTRKSLFIPQACLYKRVLFDCFVY